MRQTTKNNITIQYPDAVGFAFLPCIIKASGSGVASIEATISRETKTYTYSVEAFADNCIMDYREYVQALFDASASETSTTAGRARRATSGKCSIFP